MYEMLAGRGPFEARTPAEWMAAHIATPPTDVQSVRPGISAGLAGTIMACLAKTPETRPANSHTVLGQLDLLATTSSGSTPASPKTARRRVVPFVLSVLVMVVIAFTLRNTATSRTPVTGGSAAEPLVDSVRLRVAFLPVVSEARDSVLATALLSAQIASLQADTRLSPQSLQRIRSLATDIGLPPTATDSLRQLYRDLGIHAYLVPTIARAGDGMLLVTEAYATRSDSLLFRLQTTANSAGEYSQAVQTLTKDVTDSLAARHQRVARPAVSGRLFGTTPEAAALYLEGREYFQRREFAEAAKRLKRAVAADSEFAMAWLTLSASLGNGGLSASETALARERAFALRDRVPSKTRRAFHASYYYRSVGQADSAVAIVTQALKEAPGDEGLTLELALAYSFQRRFDLAARVLAPSVEQALARRMSVTNVPLLFDTYLEAGRSDDARALLQQFERALGGNEPTTIAARAYMASVSMNADSLSAAGKDLLRVASSDSDKLPGYAWMRSAMLLTGRLDSVSALEATRRRIAAQENQKSFVVGSAASQSLWLAELGGDRARATRLLDSTLAAVGWATLSIPDRRFQAVLTARIALGDIAGARRGLTEWERTTRNFRNRFLEWDRAAVDGELALSEGDGAKALARFRAADVGRCSTCSWARFARAFDRMGQADSVIYWYERLLARPSAAMRDQYHEIARAYRRLGELYEAKGDTKRAIQRYGDFVELLKNADPALQPLVKDGCA